MTDIVTELRDHTKADAMRCARAADEIERLRGVVEWQSILLDAYEADTNTLRNPTTT